MSTASLESSSEPSMKPSLADSENVQRQATIQLENLGKSFDGFVAVSDINLSIYEGEFFSFLGPNGAGKTTTIKMMTGMLKPTHGRALVGGYDIQQDPTEAKRLIGHIPDHPYLYEKLTGREFVRFIGDLYGMNREEQEAERLRYFDLFALEYAADRLIENYSHGMRQKLCFTVALMHRPKILVVDEPMVGLDPHSARTVKNLMREQCERGATVFLSTHTLSVAEELSNRIGIITQGKIRFLGGIHELQSEVRQEGNLEDLFLELTKDGITREV